MKRFFGQSDHSSGAELFNATYEDNRWTKEEALCSPLTIEEVLGTQALVMQLLSERPRSVMHGNKRHVFSSLNNINTEDFEFYDGSREEYVSCRVAKVSHGRWQMRIKFRENEISRDNKQKSYFDDFAFDWLRNGNLQAWYGTYSVDASAGHHHEDWRDIHPLASEEIEELHTRLRRHSLLASAAIEKSISAGKVPRSFGTVEA